eukprot:TRINITY_DN5868_c0_g1_i4.p1 TRINITY_DN5868_c0_g1~~TRINITY_DN5868_c0_g1_i4.p1  ORF type:complete len:135 (-),score=19.29 TRINITY_DN5868_c0_g1_i4:56-460(-)
MSDSGSVLFDDFWEIIPSSCYTLPSCSLCAKADGCGWCSSNETSTCVPGYLYTYLPGDCGEKIISTPANCPSFPLWASLTVSGGVIFMLLVVFCIVKFSIKGKEEEALLDKDGYEDDDSGVGSSKNSRFNSYSR